jgi:hypothetical protein
MQKFSPEDTQSFMILLVAALSGIEAPRTLKITGLIQGLEILILVDSGSSHSFISEQVATSVKGVIASPQQTQVKVVDDNILKS